MTRYVTAGASSDCRRPHRQLLSYFDFGYRDSLAYCCRCRFRRQRNHDGFGRPSGGQLPAMMLYVTNDAAAGAADLAELDLGLHVLNRYSGPDIVVVVVATT